MRVPTTILADDPITNAQDVALAASEAVKHPLQDHLDRKRKLLYGSLALVLLGSLLGVGLPAATGGTPNFMLAGGGLLAGLGGYWYANNQSPNVTVTGVERRYWTGYTLPTDDGTMLFDATGTAEATSFELPEINDPSVVQQAHHNLDVENYPVVLPRGESLEDNVQHSLETLRDELATAEERTVEAPLIEGDDPLARSVDTLVSHASFESQPLESEQWTFDQARDLVNTVEDMERLAFDDNTEQELESLESAGTETVDEITTVQSDAIDLLNDHLTTAADLITLQSYAFYCPDCDERGVVAQVTPVDESVSTWFCETCESRFDEDSDLIIPKHRMKDELIEDIWERLWIEKDDQRRQIYENIEDQQSDLKEREFEKRRDAIESATDRIQDIRTNLKDYEAEAHAAKGAVNETGQLLQKYERIHENRLQEFQQDVEQALTDIEARVEQELEQNRVDRDELIKEAEAEIEEQAQLRREEEIQLEKEKIALKMSMEKELAEETLQYEQAMESARTAAEMEQREQHHRFNKILDTREEGVSAFGTVNKAHLAVGRLTGFNNHRRN